MSVAFPSRRPYSPEFALLGLLYLRPDHGYDLHRRLTAELGEIWRVSQSQTYKTLKRLQSQGYLTATLVIQEKLPPQQNLELTLAGRRRFEAWLDAPTSSSLRAIRLDFLTRLYFARQLDPQRIPVMLNAQIQQIQQTIARLEAALADSSVGGDVNRLSLQLHLHLFRSVIAWLEECARTFVDSSSTGRDSRTQSNS